MTSSGSWRPRLDAFLSRSARALERHQGGRFLADTVRAVFAVAQGFRGERISLRASALTYISIFSLVPLLAVTLALVSALGPQGLHQYVRAFLFDVLAPGIREDGAAVLDRFLRGASTTTAGSLGFVALAFSAASLLRNLDSSINEIWNVRRKRGLAVRISFYALILVVGPVLLALSLAGMGMLSRLVRFYFPFAGELLAVGGALISISGFTLLYFVAPAAGVRFRSALAGGLVAGFGWDLAKHLYGALAERAFHASPVWGSLGAIPLALTWIYVSWLLLLFGARLSYAVQFAWFSRGMPELVAYPRSDALIAARIAAALSRATLGGEGPTPVRTVSDQLHLTVEAIEPALEQLVRCGLVRLLPGGLLEPARPLEELSMADIALAVGGAELPNPPSLMGKKPLSGLEAALDRAEDEFLARLRRIRWKDLPGLDQPLPSGEEERPQEAVSRSAGEKP